MDGADWLRSQLTSFGCAACGRAFLPTHIRILAQRDGLFFVDLGCEQCGSQDVAVVTVQIDDQDVARANAGEYPRPTIDTADAPRDGTPPVDADDLLDMHAFLATFHGDPRTLFSPTAAGAE